MSEPSVLTYARFFGLTRAYTNCNIWDNLRGVQKRYDTQAQLRQTDDECLLLSQQFQTAALDFDPLHGNDRFKVPEDVEAFFQSCAPNDPPDLNRVYDENLPRLHEFEKYKLKLPLLLVGGGDVERDVQKIRRGIDFHGILDDIMQNYVEMRRDRESEQSSDDTNADEALLEMFLQESKRMIHDERLEVTSKTMRYLRDNSSIKLMEAERFKIIENTLPQLDRPAFSSLLTSNAIEFQVEEDTNYVAAESLGEGSTLRLGSDTEAGSRKRKRCILDDNPRPNSQRLTKQPSASLEISNASETEADQLLGQLVDSDMEIDFAGHGILSSVSDTLVETVPGNASEASPNRDSAVHVATIQSLSLCSGSEFDGDAAQLQKFKLQVPRAVHQQIRLPSLVSIDSPDIAKADLQHTASGSVQLPFSVPSMQDVLKGQRLENTAILDMFVEKPRPVIKSQRLLWKEPGFRLLDRTDDEDLDVEIVKDMFGECETEVPEPQSENNHQLAEPGLEPRGDQPKIESEFLKPNMDVKTLHDISTSPDAILPLPLCLRSSCAPHMTEETTLESSHVRSIADEWNSSIDESNNDWSSLLDDCLSAEFKDFKYKVYPCTKSLFGDDSLSTFLDLRGKQFKAPMKQYSLNTVEIGDDPIESTQQLIIQDLDNTDHHPLAAQTVTIPLGVQDVVLPEITPLTNQKTIVVNDLMLRKRPLLIQFLERQDPNNLTLIYRDLGSVSQRVPEIILNPTSCLIVTNMQSLGQRPLPGNTTKKSLSTVHDHITFLAQEYEHIFVLVCSLMTSDLAARTKAGRSQTAFMSFCKALSKQKSLVEVVPTWLPCVDPASYSNAINAWTWGLIQEHAQDTPSLSSYPMMHEVTSYEFLLCKAGLNPMAAQVVIGSLISLEAVDDFSSDETVLRESLRNLAGMTNDKRMTRYGGSIGKNGVDRLNRALEG